MKKLSYFITLIISLLSLTVCGCDVTVDYTEYEHRGQKLSISFLELGNKNSGDSILIEMGNYDILVDAGSKTTSFDTIKSYLDEHVEDHKIEYVIVTHAHEDHYANFAGNGNETTSLFHYYDIDNIIEFAKTNQHEKNAKGNNTMYGNYVYNRDLKVASGTKLCNAYESYNNLNNCKREISLDRYTKINILNNYYYENNSTGENNFSVCFLLTHFEHKFLFTGDLEEDGEVKLLELNDIGEVDLFKAGHHGSNTSSSDALLSVIKPKIVVVTCVAGGVEYSPNLNNTFPTKRVLATIAKYTDQVYVTTKSNLQYDTVKEKYIDAGFESLNGTIVVTSTREDIEVKGSNNNDILKDSTWYHEYYENYRNKDYPWDINE